MKHGKVKCPQCDAHVRDCPCGGDHAKALQFEVCSKCAPDPAPEVCTEDHLDENANEDIVSYEPGEDLHQETKDYFNAQTGEYQAVADSIPDAEPPKAATKKKKTRRKLH